MGAPSILIVEDEAVIAIDLQETLVGLGYTVYGPVATGEEALAAVAATTPDLVMLDIRLAGELDGIAVAEQLWATMDIPIVFLTAHADAETVVRAGETEPYAYLLKPFDEGELAITLQLVLQRSGRDRAQSRYMATLTAAHDASHEALANVTAALHRAEQSRDMFLASLSHELRTPLSAILGAAELLDDGVLGDLNGPQRAAVHRIERGGAHLLTLVARLLDYVALWSGRATVHYETVPLEQVCQQCLDVVRPAANAKLLQLSSSVPAGLTVSADQERLIQMLTILLENAVKFTLAGGQVGLEVALDGVDECVQVTVWDTGIGIAEEQRDQLFQPFVQLDASLARPYEGAGLGLALAHRVAELHRGTITVESTPGHGSRFIIRIPQRIHTPSLNLPT
ncbi:MAG: hybrid sensor histidine kinase/response regulator [Chloroflexales bacterium]|nr:hybrid sensor histidine kinase/response regulator [Chloroflexales bacterium]